jgi:uncharacterized protein YqgC (DUF456 family)
MDTGSILLLIFAIVIIALGLAGLILPALPGQVLLFAGLVLAAWAEDFAYVGGMTIAILAFITVLSFAVDFLAGVFGAKRFGASRRALAGAACGAVFGIFFGFIGAIIGPFIGAVLGQLSAGGNFQTAGRAGIGAWLGFLFGTATKIALGFSMIGIFLVSRFL